MYKNETRPARRRQCSSRYLATYGHAKPSLSGVERNLKEPEFRKRSSSTQIHPRSGQTEQNLTMCSFACIPIYESYYYSTPEVTHAINFSYTCEIKQHKPTGRVRQEKRLRSRPGPSKANGPRTMPWYMHGPPYGKKWHPIND